jgi:methylated-DNA-[protein]-cysteine S-methyltransferase
VVAYEADGWGRGELWLRGDVLVHHELPQPVRPTSPEGSHPLADRFSAYFAGARDDFADVELDLEGATPFTRAVIETLRAVPHGETVTYGELAALAGHPNAHRAAGSVCAGNRFPLVVPCHRVVAASGLGPYGSTGTEYKRRLLEHEDALPGPGGRTRDRYGFVTHDVSRRAKAEGQTLPDGGQPLSPKPHENVP